MKYLISLSLILLASCGNPHVSSKRVNEPIPSPLTQDECDEALSATRIYTEEELYQSVAHCQEQEQEQYQEQAQLQTESLVSLRFKHPVSHAGVSVPDFAGAAVVRVSDCDGALVHEEEITLQTAFIGVAGENKEICELSITR